jgi:4-amino-4-deoxy-L-arabinose transferase-like glycosyltransferase
LESNNTRTTFLDAVTSRTSQVGAIRVAREDVLRPLALGAILLLAAALRFANLAALGYVNHYYAAAVESMSQSWHNFFFVAAEPGGSVSVDKPPVGLWLQTISAHFFGVNSLGLLLPQIVAGLLSIIVLYHLVRRSFGTVAGLLAALAMAVTPVAVAVDRNNTIDSTLVLTLLLATWAFIKATESGRLRYLLMGAALVGVGFNIKMLEAYLPLPALYALYFLGSADRLWRKLGKLTLATMLLLAVSFSWAIVVDLTPASQRPFVGSSGDNSVMSLAIGYNGVERLMGMGGRGGLLGGLLGNLSIGGQSFGAPTRPQGQAPNGNGGFQQRGPGGLGSRATPGGQPGPGGQGAQTAPGGQPGQAAPGGQGGFGAAPRGGFGGGAGGGFMGGTGRAGALRLFTAPLSKEAGWLLPFALFGVLLLAFRARPRWPLAPKHRAMVMWGLWLLTEVVFFSVAGFFHEYYLSMLVAPLSALVGIAVMELWRLRDRVSWLAILLLVAAAAGTLRLQVDTATAFMRGIWWLPAAIGLMGIGGALLIASSIRRWRGVAALGFSCVVVSLLITPTIWSGLTAMNPTANQSLPAAYAGQPSTPIYGGKLQLNSALLDYLQRHTQDTKYLMAVPSSMQGADYVLATGRPVLYLGGFMGQDQVVTPADLDRLAATGELRYIYWTANSRGGFGGGNQAAITQWVTTHCRPVQGFDTATQNAGAPDGTSDGASRNGGGQFQGPGGMQITLYQVIQPGGTI